MKTINNIYDLLNFFGADSPNGLNREIYNKTDCGASISIYLNDGTEYHNDEDWMEADEIEKLGLKGFSIQTIIEGSDATIDSGILNLPVSEETISNWMSYMEEEAATIWEEENGIEEDDKYID